MAPNQAKNGSEQFTLGVMSCGGLAAGINQVIQGIANQARDYNIRVQGVIKGWDGLTEYQEPINLTNLSRYELHELCSSGGSILKSSMSKLAKTDMPAVRENMNKYGIDALASIGGDGTYMGMRNVNTWFKELQYEPVPNIHIPKTMDNDLEGTDRTFGFETAVNEAAQSLSDMRAEAKAYDAIALVEVMGRDAGWVALDAGYVGGADITLIGEFPIPKAQLLQRAQEIHERQGHVVIAVAENYVHDGQTSKDEKITDGNGAAKLGGIGKAIAADLTLELGIKTKSEMAGYRVRNNPPVSSDFKFASEMGAYAAYLTSRREFERMICLQNGQVIDTPLGEPSPPRLVTEVNYNIANMMKWDLPHNVVSQVLQTKTQPVS